VTTVLAEPFQIVGARTTTCGHERTAGRVTRVPAVRWIEDACDRDRDLLPTARRAARMALDPGC
jgi:hypothetical protein